MHFCLSDRSANDKGMDSEHMMIVQYVHDYFSVVSYAPRGQLLLGFVPNPKWVGHPPSVDTRRWILKKQVCVCLCVHTCVLTFVSGQVVCQD